MNLEGDEEYQKWWRKGTAYLKLSKTSPPFIQVSFGLPFIPNLLVPKVLVTQVKIGILFLGKVTKKPFEMFFGDVDGRP